MQLAFIIPYRDRAKHLNQFLPHHRKLFPNAQFYVIEQEAGKPFNRGKLLNIGFLEAKEADYFAFQDVDMLALQADYSPPASIRQLAGSNIQKVNYFGGVTLFSKEAFLKADGYSNEFFCRAEDNQMFKNVTEKGIAIENKFGKFAVLPHKRNGPEFDPVLWERAQQPRVNDGLSFCTYKVLQVKALINGKKITVSI
jgi:beta-1,4-galactosyltransferase 4